MSDTDKPMTVDADETLLPLREVERRHIFRVLDRTGGNRTEAARILGLDRKTLYRKLLRYGDAPGAS
jgi:DNA-binding NtrC family response regulator